MLRFLLRRLGTSLLIIVGITLVTFVLTHLVPSNPAVANLGQVAANNPKVVAAFNAAYGFNKPLTTQYGLYLWHLLHGNLGTSVLTGGPVADALFSAIPATIELSVGALVIALPAGVALGLLSAIRRGTVLDRALVSISVLGLSIPTFWLALEAFYIFYFRLGIAPGSGRLAPSVSPPPRVTGLYTVDSLLAGQWSTFGDAVAHLALPSLVLAFFTLGLIVRFTRSAALEILDQDYVRAAVAKGLPPRTVIVKYVLRAALVPIITVAGLAAGSLLSGTVLVEEIFAWHGVGEYAFNTATQLDLPGIMGVGLFVGVAYVAVNLIVDVLYTFIDPRIRLS